MEVRIEATKNRSRWPTFAPLWASSMARPAPIPREAPVTMATLPFRGSAAFSAADMVSRVGLCLRERDKNEVDLDNCRFLLDVGEQWEAQTDFWNNSSLLCLTSYCLHSMMVGTKPHWWISTSSHEHPPNGVEFADYCRSTYVVFYK